MQTCHPPSLAPAFPSCPVCPPALLLSSREEFAPLQSSRAAEQVSDHGLWGRVLQAVPGDLTVPPALHHLLHHRTLLLHRQHLLLHLPGLPGGVLPQPAPRVPLLEETPHLQGALRGSARLCPGSPGSIRAPPQLPAPTCCNRSSGAARGSSVPGIALCSLRGPQDGAKLPLPGGSSLQLSSLQGTGGSKMLSVFWEAPQGHPQILISSSWGHPGDPSPLVLPLCCPVPQCAFRMLHMPHCAFRCSLGVPVCIPGHTTFLLVPFRSPQESPFAFWCGPEVSVCLSVCSLGLLVPPAPSDCLQ